MNPLNRVRRVLCNGAIAVAAAGAAALLLGAPATAHGDGHHTVAIKQYMFMPTDLDIEQGETVTWTNFDTAAHDVTITSGPASFHSPLLAQGKSWSHTFSVPGSYSYICSVHPEMKATVVVAAATPVSRPTPAVATAPRPVTSSAAPTHRTAVHHDPARTQAQATVSRQAKATKPALVSGPQSSATLQPLILVVGASVAVVLFCLLLMASRPVRLEDLAGALPGPKHLEDT